MRRLLILVLAVLISVGCSSSNGPILPGENSEGPNGELTTANASQVEQGGKTLWGMYEWVIDLQAETFEIVPLRAQTSHFNVVRAMNAFPPRVSFDGFILDKPNNTISLDVFLYHPFPHRPNLAGFDVHGTMIGSGSVSGFSDSTLVVAGPEDPHIINPDGWTRWWNPVEFNIGDDLFSYTDGNKGVPLSVGDYNATLNGYKTFSDDLGNMEYIGEMNIPDRLIFTTDAVHSRHYDVWFPVVANKYVLRYNYAIDVSWEPIPGYESGDPVDAPSDWEPDANQAEPFWATADEKINGLYFESSTVKGGTATLEVKVYDWQGYLNGGDVADEIESVTFECPGAYDGVEMGTMTDPGPGSLPYATYEIELDGDKLSSNQLNMMLITVQSANGDYQPSLTGYSGTAPLSYYRWMALPTVEIEAPLPNDPPVAVATMDNEGTVLIDTTVTFDASGSYDDDGAIVSYEWDFDNDGTYGDPFDDGTDLLPEVTFDTPGEYWIDLKVTDDDDDWDNLDEKLHLVVNPHPNVPPVAIATSNKIDVMVGELVDFDGSYSYDTDGSIMAWEWDFDDDGTFGDPYDSGTDDMPILSFDNAGMHFVDLMVTDDGTDTDTLDEKLAIMVTDPDNSAPEAKATVDKDEGDIGELFTFDGTGSSDIDGFIVSWEWDFDNDGIFGDAYDSGTDEMPEITFGSEGYHFINLRVTDDDGGIDSLDEKLVITINPPDNQPPVALAEVDTYTNYIGDSFSFDATASYDLDGIIVMYEWDFDGDGSFGDVYDSGTDVMPVISYDTPGELCVCLRVWDDDGASDVLDEDICITIEEIPNEPPVAYAGVEPYEGYVGDTFYFYDDGSYDPDGIVVSWAWDFDEDGSYGDAYPAGTDQYPEYIFMTPGLHCVDLMVTDDDGATDTLDEVVCVNVLEVPNVPPVAIADVDPDYGYIGDKFYFDGSSSYDTDGFIVSWEWDFDGDGIFGDPYDGGTDEMPEYIFDEADEYCIDLMVTDDDGATDTLDELICILVEEPYNEPPVAIASLVTVDPFDIYPLEFAAEASYDPDGFIVDWQWDFNNDGFFGDPFDGGTMDHPFKSMSAGPQIVNLKVIDNEGAEDTLDIPIEFFVNSGVMITLPEDQDYKSLDSDWNYVALNAMTPGDLPFDPSDHVGPWDFTTVAYPDAPDTFDVLPTDDPAVEPFILGYYPPTTAHVVNMGIVGSEYYGQMYIPEEPDFGSDLLKVYGFFGENLITGTTDIYVFNTLTGGPVEMVYPLDITSDQSWTRYFPSVAGHYQVMQYHEWSTGQAGFDVPYSGPLAGVALQTCAVWQLHVFSELAIEAMIYKWIDDDGVEVARLYVVNNETVTNFDPITYEVTGASRLLVLDDD